MGQWIRKMIEKHLGAEEAQARLDDNYVVVTTLSQFRIRYVMHVDDLQALNPDIPVTPIEWAKETVTLEECEEFSQEHLGEVIIDSELLTENGMLKLFDADNDYLADWNKEQKVKWVRNNLKGPSE